MDFSLVDGSMIPIEERDPDEVRFFGVKTPFSVIIALIKVAGVTSKAGL
ncbi:MAG: hypothetical protein U9Q39_05885 [Pseudomonadota bacterium]|nr:hypothetical protein [Pseudomonadota bacterium]